MKRLSKSFIFILLLAIFSFLLVFLYFQTNNKIPFVSQHNLLSAKSLYKDLIPKGDDKILLNKIRNALVNGDNLNISKDYDFSFKFNPDYSWVSVTLYQENQRPLRYISKRETLENTINRVIYKLRERDRFPEFDVLSPFKVRIGFEIINTPFEEVKISHLSRSSLNKKRRFEVGVDGLKINFKGEAGFFMPTDGYVRNKLYIKDVIEWLEHRYDVDVEDCEFYKFQSRSFVTFENYVIALYRGYPVKRDYTNDDLEKTVLNGLDWLVKNQRETGRFIYFVDSITGETKDYLYKRTNLLEELGMERYYNILRHSGALLSLLRGYQMYKKEEYIDSFKKGLDYLEKTVKIRKTKNNKEAAYVFFNKKAKLGGSGLALVAFSRYQKITADDKYYFLAEKIARHILNEIKKDGEFNYYYIHPLQGEKPQDYFFSFYYPGEALLGLGEFYKICKDEVLKESIAKKSEKALDFLLFIRPKKYSEYYKSLPSDSWLMSAILELTKIPQLNKDEYKQFVYSDALKMVKHQYNFEDALYTDYVGGFYYSYGDHVYPDGARSEGLFSACELAKREEKRELSDLFLKKLKLAALCQLHLVNTRESIYPSQNRKIAFGGIRFKLTRQWFRIDTIQHVVNFYMRLLKELNNISRDTLHK